MKSFLLRAFSAVILVSLLLAGQGAQPAYAASFTVNSLADNNTAGDGNCTLREAIETANNAGNGDCGPNSPANDTITFSVSGTITLGSTLPAIVSGQGTLTIDGGGNITISGNNSVQVMYVNSGATLTLQNLTISNGDLALGGGLYNAGGTVTITNSAFSNNNADYGGGLFNHGGTVDIVNSVFSDNSAAYYGGGIYNYGTMTLTNSVFSSNSAAYGGGFFNYGMVTLTNSTFSDNSATISGGGILSIVTVTLTNSTFSGNSAEIGGGLYNGGTMATLTNSTFSNNSATISGGGIYNGGAATLTNITVSNNSATTSGGGIYNDSGTVNVTNSIVANSSSGGNCSSNYGAITAAGTNFATDGTCSGFTTTTTAALNLGPLANNGGPTQTHALLAGSVAIDAATGACPPPSTDQRGVSRPLGAACDVGAYERDSTPPSLVSITRFNPPGSPTSANTLIFHAAFSKDVQNVDASDFNLNATPATTATITAVTQVSPSLYEITVSGGDLGANTYNGVIQLDITAGQNITDLVGNPLSPPPANETYLVQHLPSFSPPVVGSVTATGAGTLWQGQALTSGPSQFTVTFNADVTAASAENTANYLLVRAGGNGVQTLSCAGGVSGGDTAISIDSAVYAPATYTTTLNVNGGQPLPAGLYRLFVCGTTSIVNANGDELYAGLTDFGMVFSVLSNTPGGGGSGTSGTSGGALQLPNTGFPFGRVTLLPQQPAEKTYAATDLTLEIPALRVKASIVGVLKSDGSWDVSWLGNAVGWLEGSAFPTWKGNTVLTAHVWNADNTPGLFANLKDLKYGDRFTIHAYGQTYIYEVRENTWLWGANRVDKVFKPEELDWVTLLTCEGYNPLSGSYNFRRMVRAVLVGVK